MEAPGLDHFLVSVEQAPQIAIAVVMENGTATASGQVARLVMDAYFAGQKNGVDAAPEGELVTP